LYEAYEFYALTMIKEYGIFIWINLPWIKGLHSNTFWKHKNCSSNST